MKNIHNLQAWEALLIATKSGSISKSALLMGLEPSKVSRLIAGLERELGYELLDKTHRPYTPTKKGEAVVNLLDPLVKSLKKITESPVSNSTNQTVIRISAPVALLQDFYADKLIAYSKTHLGITFELLPEDSPNKVLSGEVDIAIVNRAPVSNSDLVVHPVFENSTPVVCTPEYLRRYGVPKTPGDLTEHVGILLKNSTNEPINYLYYHGQDSFPLKWKMQFCAHDQSIIKKLVLGHQGVSPDLYFGHVLEELESGKLIPILPGWGRAPWQMTIITRQDKDINNSDLRDFTRWLVNSDRILHTERARKAGKVLKKAFKRTTEIVNSIDR